MMTATALHTRWMLICAFLPGLAALPAAPAEAMQIYYPDFTAHTDELVLLGSAAPCEGRLRLTPAASGCVGAAWYETPQPVGCGFETTFRFQISDPDSTYGVDGFAFVLQAQGDQAIGTGGGNLGYVPIRQCLAVEFDMYHSRRIGPPFADTCGNEISVHSNGRLPVSQWELYSLGNTPAPSDMSDGLFHTVRITYVNENLDVFYDDLLNPVLSIPVNVEQLLWLQEDQPLWVGFTAATSPAGFSYYQNHDILDWNFTHMPEPTSLVLLGLGGWALVRKKKIFP